MDRTPEYDLLRRQLDARRASFALGVPGVAAEFHWVDGERVEHDDGGLGIATARGAIRIRRCGAERVAGDAGSPDLWWLHADAAAFAQCAGLAELGPDAAAVRPADRAAVRFDLGLALGHVRACVRTTDAALLAVLRAHLGEAVLRPGHPALAAIKAAGPHRVFSTRMARIEVYQPIPSRARGERTPAGPHTHLLPALLGRDEPQRARLPAHACPVLAVYTAAAPGH